METVAPLRAGADRVLRGYSLLAPVYELFGRPVQSAARARLRQLASVRDGESILEVAPGTGVQLLALARQNPSGRTVALEASPGMRRRARSRLLRAGRGDVEVHAGDARHLPFADGSFDLVVNECMLNSLSAEDIPLAVGELARVLRPGGRLLLATMTVGERSSHRLWEAAYRLGLNVTAHSRGICATPYLERAGLKVAERSYIARLGFPIEVLRAQKG